MRTYLTDTPSRALLGIHLLLMVVLCACTIEKPVQFPVYYAEVELFARGSAAQEGVLDFSSPKKLEYRFDNEFAVLPYSSLQIKYEFNIPLSQEILSCFELILYDGKINWTLPMDGNVIYSYFIPAETDFKGKFSISLVNAHGSNKKKIDKRDLPVFKILSIGINDRFFGYKKEENIIAVSPFVKWHDASITIDVPHAFWPSPAFAGVRASFAQGGAVLQLPGHKLEAFNNTTSIYYSSDINIKEPGTAVLTGTEITSFMLRLRGEQAEFPIPVIADPALVISWQKADWRNKDYEVFSWDRFANLKRYPPILIFDYADYALQDNMLKRLAFFVEKAGFRGRLASDEEIKDLHGWNAHDYRAEDLARFFDLARKSNFPLLKEELELEQILLFNNIIRDNAGSIVPGEGAIISITRESPDYLRYRFMVHEAYHALYFIDEDFRDFSKQRWGQLSAPAKRFILSYFGFQQYDTNDEYLLLNEFMAHVLQQPVSSVAEYFGKYLPERLERESSWRAAHLPEKNEATGTWPELADAFTKEAQAFSSYVNERWGLVAGRVWGLRVR